MAEVAVVVPHAGYINFLSASRAFWRWAAVPPAAAPGESVATRTVA